MKTIPVAIIFHRRPELVRLLMERIRSYQPAEVLLVADGPAKEEDRSLCLEARRVAEQAVDWPARVRKNYSGPNLGLRRRLETGLDWVFSQVPFAILLEEDCHPRPDFFPFVEAMEKKYSAEHKVGAISGNCFLPVHFPLADSYFFSRYPHIWGWATWARAWKYYDRENQLWPRIGGARSFWPEMSHRENSYWQTIFDRVYAGKLETWDYRWLLGFWSGQFLAITPSQNLVDNAGFGPGATNTHDVEVDVGADRNERLGFPLQAPPAVERNEMADRAVFRNHYLRMEGKLPFWSRLIRSFGKRLPRIRRREGA